MGSCVGSIDTSFSRASLRRAFEPDDSCQHLENKETYWERHGHAICCPEVASEHEAGGRHGQTHLKGIQRGQQIKRGASKQGTEGKEIHFAGTVAKLVFFFLFVFFSVLLNTKIPNPLTGVR